jgi:hypothetical protein
MGFVLNAGLVRDGVECRQHVLALFRLFSVSPAMMPGMLAVEPERKWPGTSTCTSQATAAK